MKTGIVEGERGPQILGTRITVYDILDYLEEGWHHTRIAAFFHPVLGSGSPADGGQRRVSIGIKCA